MTDGHHYFGAEHTLFYLPSASALPFMMKGRAVGRRMLALAESRPARLTPLTFADAEVKTVANLYGAKPLTGTASKSEFLKRASQYDLIHIAAHTLQNTISPLFYGILLGGDKGETERLEIREINNLDLTGTSLVVLSACHTDWGLPDQGDDIIALSRAFLYTGASSVIASLWLVDDSPTSELMASFYTHLKSGMSKAEALRAAQSDTRRKYPDPFHWASFVLTGDPGGASPKQIAVANRNQGLARKTHHRRHRGWIDSSLCARFAFSVHALVITSSMTKDALNSSTSNHCGHSLLVWLTTEPNLV